MTVADALSTIPPRQVAIERPGERIVLPGQSPEGEYILSVLVKRTYTIVPGRQCVRAATDRKLAASDTHFDDPMSSTVQYESDFVPFKLATDVVLNAKAYAPNGRPVQELMVALGIDDVVCSVRVIGDRQAHYRSGCAPGFSDPVPFTVMPIRYERAFGGVDVRSDADLACPYGRNHLGKGFAIRNAPEVLEGLLLPNIEDPTDLLAPERLCCGHFIHMDELPGPAGFGWTMKIWRPRLLLAGVMPADVAVARELRDVHRLAVPASQRALYDQTELPPMDFRFFNGASNGLVRPYLRGDEVIRTKHLALDGRLDFVLPGDQPHIAIDIGAGSTSPVVRLHTVMIRLDEGEVDLVWRGAIPYAGPDWLPEMRRLDVEIR
jgi:hypothetical protein